MPQQPERYFVGPNLRDKLREVITRVDGMPAASGGGGKIPVVHQEIPRPSAANPVRLGKTTSAWSKGTLATIELYNEGDPPAETKKDPPDTLPDCVNKIANVGDDKWVIVARGGNGYWYLVWAEPELVDVIVDAELGEAAISFGRKTVAVYTVEPDPEPISIIVTECPPD